jgi:hypothetical protein
MRQTLNLVKSRSQGKAPSSRQPPAEESRHGVGQVCSGACQGTHEDILASWANTKGNSIPAQAQQHARAVVRT